MKKIGMVIIMIGLVMSIMTGINLITKRKVVDLGKVEITKEENNPIKWSPFLGVILIGTGLLITIAGKKKSFD